PPLGVCALSRRPTAQYGSRLPPLRDCVLCGSAGRHSGLCAACEQAICRGHRHADGAQPSARCSRCALGLPADAAPCPDCSRQLPDFDRTIAAFDYLPPADQLILPLKQGGHTPLAAVLGRLLVEALHDSALPVRDRPACVVPIPASPISLTRRGFNPAGLIA